MAKSKLKHRIKIWVVTWPKGTTEEWVDQPDALTDYFPITAEVMQPFEYFDKKEKRTIYGSPVALFMNKAEAEAYEASQGNNFVIRPGYLEVL